MSKTAAATAATSVQRPAGVEMKIAPQDLVLVEDKSHPLYQERVHRPADWNMVNDMVARGWMHGTVLVVEDEAGSYLVVAGRGRAKAATEAGLKEIPVVCLGKETAFTHSELKAAMARENERRVDTSPLEKAKDALSLLNSRLEEAKPKDWDDAVAWKPSKEEKAAALQFTADVFGWSTSRLSNVLSLLNEDKISAGLTKAMKNGDLGVNAALVMTKLNPIEQEEALARMKPLIDKKAREAVESGGKKRREVSRSEADAIVNRNSKCTFERAWLEKILSRRSTPPEVKAFVKELLNPGSQELPYLPGKLEKLRQEVDETE